MKKRALKVTKSFETKPDPKGRIERASTTRPAVPSDGADDVLTPQFLALLAAELSDRRDAPRDSVQRALAFFDEAKGAINERRTQEEIRRRREASKSAIVKPDQFPTDLDTFLKNAMPKSAREGERFKAGKEFLKWQRGHEVDFGSYRGQPIDELAYEIMSDQWDEWRPAAISVKRSNAAKGDS